MLLRVSQAVPGGVVCFLPSYQYESVVVDHLKKTQVYEQINKHKQVTLGYQVTQSISSQVPYLACQNSGTNCYHCFITGLVS